MTGGQTDQQLHAGWEGGTRQAVRVSWGAESSAFSRSLRAGSFPKEEPGELSQERENKEGLGDNGRGEAWLFCVTKRKEPVAAGKAVRREGAWLSSEGNGKPHISSRRDMITPITCPSVFESSEAQNRTGSPLLATPQSRRVQREDEPTFPPS